MEILEPVLDSPRTVWAACGVIYAINCVFVCMRPEIAMEFDSTKWNRCLLSRLPTDSPLLCFGTVKIVLVCMNWTKNVHVLCA